MTIPTPMTVLYEDYYRSISVDFPWKFTTRAPNKNPNSDRSVERHYKTMTKAELKAFKKYIMRLSDPRGCHWWFWVTFPMLMFLFELIAHYNEGMPSNKKIRYSSSGFVWIKLKKKYGKDNAQYELIRLDQIEDYLHVSLGFTTRKNVELCLLFRSGSPKRISKKVREVIMTPVREHSRKPDEIPGRIEEYCEGPYLELFSRSGRKGWTSWGDELGKFEETK